MKQFIFTILLLSIVLYASAQVGIGTVNPPQEMLTVRGSVLIDEGNNSNGALDSTALLFGTLSNTGIVGPKLSPKAALNGGLVLFAGDSARLSVHRNGNIRINDTTTVNTNTRLVVGGRSSFKGAVAVGGDGSFIGDNEFSVNGKARIAEDATIVGRVGIGGVFPPSDASAYRLIVAEGIRAAGDLFVDDDASIGGTLSVTENVTVGGGVTVAGELVVDANNGIVKSNTTDQLRLAFNGGAFSFVLNPGSHVDVTFAISNFTGNNNNVRVSINQFIPASGSGNTWHQITMTVFETNASTNTCQIRFFNAGTTQATMNGTLYLTTVMTD